VVATNLSGGSEWTTESSYFKYIDAQVRTNHASLRHRVTNEAISTEALLLPCTSPYMLVGWEVT